MKAYQQSKNTNTNTNTLGIGILSNIVVNQHVGVIEQQLQSKGISTKISFAEYDNILQECSHYDSYDVVIVMMEPSNLVEGLQHQINSFSDELILELISKTKSEIDFILNTLCKVKLVFFNKFSSMAFNHNNHFNNKYDEFCKIINEYLSSVKLCNTKVIDIDKIVAGLGVNAAYDLRFYYKSMSLYSAAFMKEYSSILEPLMKYIKGEMKKVIVFDCDNTLWGGVVGEDGIDGIEFSSETSKGRIFSEVHGIIKEMISRGCIVCLCSKNNAEDVDEVFSCEKMGLQHNDIVVKKVNWQNKATNIIEIAREINVGLDSIVFIDDSDYEIGLVKSQLPMVKAIQVPKSISQYPEILRTEANAFYGLTKTRDDQNKTLMYKEEQSRLEVKNSFANIEDYISSLNLQLVFYINDKSKISRIAQLCQKTNQFNLTTKRYSESNILNIMGDPLNIVACVEVKDDFGSLGVVGVAIVKARQNGKAELDTLLISCRALGRKVENVFMDVIIQQCEKSKVKKLKASYIKTSKNTQTAHFFDNCGFIEDKSLGDDKGYSISMLEYQKFDINFIEVKFGH